MRKKYLLFFLYTAALTSSIHSQAKQDREQNFNPGLMTSQDVLNKDFSNISIINHTLLPITVSGLYIASFDVNDCSQCFGNVIGGNNVLGTFVEPVFFRVNQNVPIGQNYLYNMIYTGLYSVQQTIGSSPCALPGCSWPGDDSQGVKSWCLSIGAMSLNSNYTFSSYTNGNNPPASVVPFTQAVKSPPFNYNYDVINPMLFGTGGPCFGPITCDDKSLTCSVQTPQSEAMQPYSDL